MELLKMLLLLVAVFFAGCFFIILVPFFLARPLFVSCLVIFLITIASSLFSAVRKRL